MDRVESIMVLEDDFVLCENFSKKAIEFLKEIPNNWDQLMLGGQHLSNPKGVKPGIVKCTNCQRTHAYAIRGRFLRELYSHWHSPNSKVHCDWIMGPLQENFKVYAPDPFIIGQRTSDSDISGRKNPTKFWIPPTGKEAVVLLKCPIELLPELRNKGLHFGYERKNDVDIGLLESYKNDLPDISRLAEWIYEIMWEVRSDEKLIVATCWHPKAHIDHLKKAWTGPVHEISGFSVEEVMKKIDLRLNNTGRIFL